MGVESLTGVVLYIFYYRFGVGGISCLLSCCNILSAVASSCYQHRDRNASEHRMIATRCVKMLC